MGKYNIREKKEKEPTYKAMVSLSLMDELEEKIRTILFVQKKYKDRNYSARRLAEDLGTNTRYVSAVMNARFHMSYTSLVNKYRVDNAMSLLADKRYQHMKMEDISDMVGFANRQSLYSSFFRFNGITPREYKLRHLLPESAAAAPSKKQPRKGGAKTKKEDGDQ